MMKPSHLILYSTNRSEPYDTSKLVEPTVQDHLCMHYKCMQLHNKCMQPNPTTSEPVATECMHARTQALTAFADDAPCDAWQQSQAETTREREPYRGENAASQNRCKPPADSRHRSHACAMHARAIQYVRSPAPSRRTVSEQPVLPTTGCNACNGPRVQCSLRRRSSPRR